MLTCSFNHADMQLSTKGESHIVHNNMEHRFPPSPGYIIGGHPNSFNFMQFVGNLANVDIPTSGKSWIRNYICCTLRFRYGTGKIKECLKEKPFTI